MRCPPNLPQYGGYLGYPGLDLERGGAELRVVPPRPRHPRHHVWQVPHQTYRLSHGAHTLDDWYLVWPHCAESHWYYTMIFRQEWSPSSSESRIWILPFFEGDQLSQFYWSSRISWFFQARGKTVEMNVYDDNHPLGKVENDVNVMINAALFFHKHLNL